MVDETQTVPAAETVTPAPADVNAVPQVAEPAPAPVAAESPNDAPLGAAVPKEVVEAAIAAGENAASIAADAFKTNFAAAITPNPVQRAALLGSRITPEAVAATAGTGASLGK